MNRLRELKQRYRNHPMHIGITKLRDGWYVAWGTSFFNSDCDGPFTKREAIFRAARMAMLSPTPEVTLEYV